jgi:hypothetical protein
MPASSGQQAVTTIVNPLGGALAHYTSALELALAAAGHRVRVESIDEPSISKRSSMHWLGCYIRVLLEARRRRALADDSDWTIVTWPVLGYVDIAILRIILGRRASVVFHDTRPLVKARGYGSLSRALASAFVAPDSLLIHSNQAKIDIDSDRVRRFANLISHPMMPPVAVVAGDGRRKVVRALGQYKPDRDLTALREIARTLDDSHVLEIVGRRWPGVEGWTVRNEYVSEAELDRLIASSGCVVIPYQRFYQSGIAIRCLERGTPVVGPKATSLSALMGDDSAMLVDETNSWATAVDHALSKQGRTDTEMAAASWYALSLSEWNKWMSARHRPC